MVILTSGFSTKDFRCIEKIVEIILCSISKIKAETIQGLKKTALSRLQSDETTFFVIDDRIIIKDPHLAVGFIKEIKNTFDCHFILALSSSPGADIKEAILTGLVDFVKKPIDAFELAVRIRTLMHLKEAKKNQEDAKQWFYQVVENMPVIFAEYEDGINVKYGNVLGSEIWGIPHEEILKPPDRWIQYIHPEDKERVVNEIKGLGKETLTIQYRIIRPDGQLRWIEDSFIPIFDNDGFRLKVFGFGSDITKRQLAEFSLQKNEEHLQFLLETVTNFAIYRVSFEAGDVSRSRVIFVSPSIVDILGVTEPSFDVWLDAFHPEDKKKLKKNLAEKPVALKYENTVRVFHQEIKDWRWIQVISNRTRDTNGNLKYSSGIMFDVTERIRTAMALKEKEDEFITQAIKLKKLNDAMSVLLDYREKEIENIKSNTLDTVKKLVKPYLQDLYLSNPSKTQQILIDIISSHLDNVTSSFARTLSNWKSKLSPTEIKVADLVRSGKTSKEISELLNVSANAVSFHRANIRSKLGLANEKINLASYLRTLEIDSSQNSSS